VRLAAVVLVIAAAIGVVSAGNPHRTPLWSGSRYSVEERDRAVFRGLDFMYRLALDPKPFRDWGFDLLSAFYNIAVTSGNPELRRRAWNMGHERALEFRRVYPDLAPNLDSGDLMPLICGNDAARRLGVPDPHLTAQLRAAAAHFTPQDWLGFDPAKEPPPADLPKACPKCGRQNARGVTICSRCGSKLTYCSRYDLFQDALIDTYSGDLAGIPMGAHYSEVLHWLSNMRPWPPRVTGHLDEYYSGIYTITHLIYTYNDYSQNRVSAGCFPQELSQLRDNLHHAATDGDPETMGEYLDSLRAFGLNFSEPEIRAGFEYLLSSQNSDGSWGDLKDPNPYGRYHPTWTAVDGLRDYRWTRTLPCPK
jgi:hypothetical protein